MDRNFDVRNSTSALPVALRKESVDRNNPTKTLVILPKESLSARRAWIEIPVRSARHVLARSLSARRAWIEIPMRSATTYGPIVALRKESVDRNPGFLVGCINRAGRSPQGERG